MFRRKVKRIEANLKIEKDKIDRYPFVEIQWLDIVGETGWQSFDQLSKAGLGRMVSRGWLYSRDKGITRIFSDYGYKDGKEGDEGIIESIGGSTIIPNSVITKITKL